MAPSTVHPTKMTNTMKQTAASSGADSTVELDVNLKTSIRNYEEGLQTLDELRTEIVVSVKQEQIKSLFEALPQDASAEIISWLQATASYNKRFLVLANSGKEKLSSDVPVDAQSNLIEHVQTAQRWLDTLNIQQAVNNVKVDTFGDWYRDPWGWPETSFLGGVGKAHVLSRALKMPRGAAMEFDVPKSPTRTRPAILLDLIDRILYQACVDSAAPQISRGLQHWVYGWRLPVGREQEGQYLHNNKEWIRYVHHLDRGAYDNKRGWRTDISDFFPSIDISLVVQCLSNINTPSRTINMIASIIKASEQGTSRKGLPQRCQASSVIANLVLSSADEEVAKSSPHLSHARWLDDMWLFSKNDSELRKTSEIFIQHTRSLGFRENPEKTDFYEGEQLDNAIDRLNLSYIDLQLEHHQSNDEGLRQALEELLSNPHHSTRHEISFVTSRIKKYHKVDLANKLAERPEALAYGADLIAPLFLKTGTWRDLVGWCADLLKSTQIPWVKTTFLRMYPRTERLPDSLIRCFAEAAAKEDTSSLLRVTALSRVAKWRPSIAKEVFDSVQGAEMEPLARRGFALAAVGAGVSKKAIHKFLLADDATACIADFLSSVSYDKSALPLKA